MIRLAIVVLATGCSFAAVRGPGPDRPLHCTTHYTAPVVDTLVATLPGVLTLLAYEARNDALENAGWFIPLAFPYGISAAFGYDNVHACREASER